MEENCEEGCANGTSIIAGPEAIFNNYFQNLKHDMPEEDVEMFKQLSIRITNLLDALEKQGLQLNELNKQTQDQENEINALTMENDTLKSELDQIKSDNREFELRVDSLETNAKERKREYEEQIQDLMVRNEESMKCLAQEFEEKLSIRREMHEKLMKYILERHKTLLNTEL